MKELNKSYKEICVILNLLGEEFTKKVPSSMISFFKRKAASDYEPNITLEDVYSQNVLPDTMAIISILYIKYWAETEAETEKYMTILREYDEEKRQALYNIFDKPQKTVPETIEENTVNKELAEHTKRNILAQKIIEILDKVKNLFSKKK